MRETARQTPLWKHTETLQNRTRLSHFAIMSLKNIKCQALPQPYSTDKCREAVVVK